jgi:hypothetical protein
MLVLQFPIRLLFEMLRVEDVITLVTAALAEEKIVLLTESRTLLTYAAESIIALLYPFGWQHVYAYSLICLPGESDSAQVCARAAATAALFHPVAYAVPYWDLGLRIACRSAR